MWGNKMVLTEKKCPKCGEIKSINEFTGMRFECNSCRTGGDINKVTPAIIGDITTINNAYVWSIVNGKITEIKVGNDVYCIKGYNTQYNTNHINNLDNEVNEPTENNYWVADNDRCRIYKKIAIAVLKEVKDGFKSADVAKIIARYPEHSYLISAPDRHKQSWGNRYIKMLREKGYITITHRVGNSSVYKVVKREFAGM